MRGWRRFLRQLLCVHDWVLISRRHYPSEGDLLSEGCVKCGCLRWRMA